MCSTFFILSMTFERFYSIIRPHKAASFNTVKKAKLIILFIVMSSVIFNIPHFFTTALSGKGCIPYAGGFKSTVGVAYYWVSLFIIFIFPFFSLLFMNGVIIHTLRKRPTEVQGHKQGQIEGQGETEGQVKKFKVKNSDKHIFVTLLLVTFGFLVLTTPSNVFLILMTDSSPKSPFTQAIYHLLLQIVGNMDYTNCGVNFFMYVLSGKKFQSDLVKLFKCFSPRNSDTRFTSTSTSFTSSPSN